MKTSRQRRITRRQFVGGALAAAGVITGAPALLRGRNLNNKLNLAFIACGGRANTNISELTITAGRNGAQGAGVAAGQESEQQVEHRVHRLRRSRHREHQRADHDARTRRRPGRQRRSSRY